MKRHHSFSGPSRTMSRWFFVFILLPCVLATRGDSYLHKDAALVHEKVMERKLPSGGGVSPSGGIPCEYYSFFGGNRRRVKGSKGYYGGSESCINTRTDEPTPVPTLLPAASTPEPTPAPGTNKPTVSQGVENTMGPTNLPCAGVKRKDAFLALLSPITDSGTLRDSNTPQGMAYLWLLDMDEGTDPCVYPTIVQRYALATFFYATVGMQWTSNTNWLSDNHECLWQFVTCDEGDNVIALDMRSNNLGGSLPPEIGALAWLQVLDLFGNQLSGEFPDTVANLQLLAELDVEQNQMTGNPLTVLVQIPSLLRLRLSFNDFDGDMPEEVSRWTLLREFWIARNRFSGEIPESIGNMTSLVSFFVYNNTFSGSLPNAMGDLGLIEFQAQHNQLSGEIPPTFWNNVEYMLLRLDHNNLNGTISQQIGGMLNMRDLRIGNNRFSGNIPIMLFALNQMVNLVLGNNNFSGQIRDSFETWEHLDFADFGDNDFTGFIPGSLFDVPTLRILYLDNNRLQGNIPDNMGNPPLLKDLYLNDNELRGQVPAIDAGQLTELTEFLISGNDITGVMPPSICALRSVGGMGGVGTLTELWADCAGSPPQIDCQCCNLCLQ